jgi:DNA-binding MarR family transcriptional regulator
VQTNLAQDFSNLLDLERHFVESLGMTALRPEAKLLLILSEAGSLTIKQAISLSGLSYRGFYLLLNRLLAQGLIEINDDDEDRRVRKMSLSRKII